MRTVSAADDNFTADVVVDALIAFLCVSVFVKCVNAKCFKLLGFL